MNILAEYRILLALALCIALLGAAGCLDENQANNATSRAADVDPTGIEVTKPNSKGDEKMDIQSQSISNLEGQTITADDGTELTVISVTQASSQPGENAGLAAIEGGVDSFYGEGSGFEMNCVSLIL